MIHVQSYEYGGLALGSDRAYYVRHMTLPEEMDQVDWMQACWLRYRNLQADATVYAAQVEQAFLIGGWLPWDMENGVAPHPQELASAMNVSDILAMVEKGMAEGPIDGGLAAETGSRYLSVWQSQPLSRWSHKVTWVISWERGNDTFWMREFLQFGLSGTFVRD